jgi:hypothetical protein
MRHLLPSFVVLAACSPVMADAIVVVRAMKADTIMEAFLDDETLRLEIEMGLADAPAFVNLLPDEIYEGLGLTNAPLEGRQKQFVTEDLVLHADGAPLHGRVLRTELRSRTVRDEISGEPVTAGESDAEPVLFFVLEYPFDQKPGSIRFKIPDRQSPGAQANIGFVFYHLGVAVNDFRYLVNGATIDLDWSDPWHSTFRSRQYRRAYDAPMNVFLYVEPYEVRVEVIIRPLDAQTWVDLGLDGRGTITPEVYGHIQGRVADLLAEHLHLTIDGRATEPVLDRINFLRRTLRSSTVIDPPEELDVFSAQLGAVFAVPCETLPERAEVTWDLFSERIQVVAGAATDEAGPLPAILTPDDNVLQWRNFLVNPTIPTMVGVITPPRPYMRLLRPAAWVGVLGFLWLVAWAGLRMARMKTVPIAQIVAAGAVFGGVVICFEVGQRSTVSADQSGEIVGALLHNVYRSFDYRQESAVYDALARSIAGDFLTTAYLETHRTLELRNQGGARVKVNDVEILECTPEPATDGVGFVADCRWIVGGSVGHWGHIHRRLNELTALVTVRAVNGAWKITGMDLRSADRL